MIIAKAKRRNSLSLSHSENVQKTSDEGGKDKHLLHLEKDLILIITKQICDILKFVVKQIVEVIC